MELRERTLKETISPVSISTVSYVSCKLLARSLVAKISSYMDQWYIFVYIYTYVL